MRIILTGTPGTGKTSLAKSLAKSLRYPLLDVKQLIRKKKIFHVNKGEKEKTVHLGALKRALGEWYSGNPDGIVESHLLCEFALPADAVVVLRCNPAVLEKRLKRRRYPSRKIRDNLLCEALDYCTQKAEENYPNGHIIEVDTSKKISAKTLLRKIRLKKSDRVNWSAWLEKNV